MRESSSTYFAPDDLKVIWNVVRNEHIIHWYFKKHQVLMKIILCIYPNVFDFKDLFRISNSDIFQLTRAVKGEELLNNKKSWLKSPQTRNK